MKLLITLLAASVLSFSVYAHEAAPTQDHIAVVGMGEVEAEPDQAVLRVTVSAQQPDLPSAKNLADTRYRKVLAVIKKAGIEEERVKVTQNLAQPQYEWRDSRQVYKGEHVSRALSITVNDLEQVSPLMQALIENEVSTIDGVDTGFQNRAGLLEQALAVAADDAKNKADFLAKRLGRNLGSAFLITESSDQPIHNAFGVEMARSRTMGADAPPPEMFGTQKVQARINVSFNLL